MDLEKGVNISRLGDQVNASADPRFAGFKECEIRRTFQLPEVGVAYHEIEDFLLFGENNDRGHVRGRRDIDDARIGVLYGPRFMRGVLRA